MNMIFCPLCSGSSGNALFVQYGRTRLLIDAGKPGRVIEDALKSIGVEPSTLSAMLITHEHSDHIAGAGVMARRWRIPIYANAGTWAAMEGKLGAIPAGCRRVFATESDFYLGDVGVVPFPIPHDAAEPVGYRLWGGRASVSTATDLGRFTRAVRDAVAGSALVLLESNHDPEMLRRNPHYSARLKERILGDHGHLSNDACADALIELVDSGVRNVLLGHLSGENNLPELALRTSQARLEREGIRLGDEMRLELAWRDRVGGVYSLGEGA